MDFFVNLPLSWVYQNPVWLERLFARSAQAAPGFKFGPELGLDAISLDVAPAWHREIAAKIKDQGLKASVHLPFFMPPPGSPAATQREQSRRVLCKAAALAAIYQAEHLIGHPSFDPAAPWPAATADSAQAAESWLERSLPIWQAVMRENQAPLFLENTYEQGPAAIIALLEALRAGGGRAAFCFDIGHWFSFAGGSRLGNLQTWLERVTPCLGHLHLHDNDGSDDQHIGLGRGRIPLEALFAALASGRASCKFTLEPHDLESFSASLDWLEQSPAPRPWLEARRRA